MVIIIFSLCSVIKPHYHYEDNICEPGLDQEKKTLYKRHFGHIKHQQIHVYVS